MEQSISSSLRSINDKIRSVAERCGRSHAEVRLLAVSKTHSTELVMEAFGAGQRAFGENYAQELRGKAEALSGVTPLEWHFIGRLQTNKADIVARHCAWVHTVDRPRIVHALEAEAMKAGTRINVLVEVHLSHETAKSGVDPEDAEELVRLCAASQALVPRGLMTMPPWSDNPEDSRPYFRRLAELREQIESSTGLRGFTELSMGMSGDFEVAIEEGATIVRVGTAVFGSRVYSAVLDS